MGSFLKGSFRASIETDIRSCYTPGASNIAVAENGPFEAVFPIKNGDIPASYVSYTRSYVRSQLAAGPQIPAVFWIHRLCSLRKWVGPSCIAV